MIELEQVCQGRNDPVVKDLSAKLVDDSCQSFKELHLLLVFVICYFLQVLYC